MLFKHIKVQDTENCYIQIYDHETGKDVIKKLYDEFNISDKNKCKNHTICLKIYDSKEGKEKEITEIDLKYNDRIKNLKIFSIVNQNTSYFYLKENTRNSIFGIKDLDRNIFKYLNDKKDIRNLSIINRRFNQIFKEYVVNTVGLIKGNPIRIFFDLDYDKCFFFNYLSQCTIKYREFADINGDNDRFRDRNVGINIYSKFSIVPVIEEKSYKFGKCIYVTFPDGITKTFADKRSYNTRRIFNQIKYHFQEKYRIKPDDENFYSYNIANSYSNYHMIFGDI